MNFLLTALVSVVVFGVLVLVHELGHFFAARRCGIRVEEFSIGFGPALFSYVKNGTRYTLRLLPLGGYNMLEGEQPDKDGEDKEKRKKMAEKTQPEPAKAGKAFSEATAWQRFFVIASGALMNFLLGIVVLVVLVASQKSITSKVIYDFEEGARSAATGLQAGDEILAVNGHTCFVADDILYELQRTPHYVADFTVRRDGEKIILPDVSFDTVADEKGEPRMKIDFRVYGLPKTPQAVLREAGNYFIFYTRVILRGFADLATGREGINELSGPVGVVSEVSKAVNSGWDTVVRLAAMLTINLGVFNLLPIPALDGCKLWLLAWEGVTHRPVPQRMEAAINTAGMALLLTLMLMVTGQDIIKLFA